ncbi:hypothetical protein [Peribacillus sp. R9-11]|uniref:hypothetical protein n=1 Tax=Peribacillus sp. R9-11 TaxID=3073271 RepID=UPI002868FDC5|nr:hypothetical protein [Peribacillus sp. R9-11]WMX58067.1 hypothetical protein RE409_13085 [Peribacillus sp. R9-11]
MQFEIYKVNNNGNKIGHATKDEYTQAVEHLINYNHNDENYTLKTIIPLQSDGETNESLVVLEKHYNEFIEVNYLDFETKENIFSYMRTDIHDILSVIKSTDELEIETEEWKYRLKYQSSSFKIQEGFELYDEILNVYFKVLDKSKNI